MSEDQIRRYNYDVFSPENYGPWMNWEASPPVTTTGPDFPLWTLYGQQTSLSALRAEQSYLIVEFGSFT